MQKIGALWCAGALLSAGICVWEATRVASVVVQAEMVGFALLALFAGGRALVRTRGDVSRWQPDTAYPRLTLTLSLFPLSLAGLSVWASVHWGDVFYLICAVPIAAIGIWGAAVGLRVMRRGAHDRA